MNYHYNHFKSHYLKHNKCFICSSSIRYNTNSFDCPNCGSGQYIHFCSTLNFLQLRLDDYLARYYYDDNIFYVYKIDVSDPENESIPKDPEFKMQIDHKDLLFNSKNEFNAFIKNIWSKIILNITLG